jgi:hypothetical protein
MSMSGETPGGRVNHDFNLGSGVVFISLSYFSLSFALWDRIYKRAGVCTKGNLRNNNRTFIWRMHFFMLHDSSRRADHRYN